MSARILVVDDNSDSRESLAMLLRAHGFEAELAANGAEALEAARSRPPDLILSDLLMPVMDGYTLLSHCKRDEQLRQVPFAVYTAACTDSRDADFACELGADAFVVKPLPFDELLPRLKQLVAMHRADELRQARLEGDVNQDLLVQQQQAVLRELVHKMRELRDLQRERELDVAKRRSIEAELRRSEHRFRQLSETIPEIFWLAAPTLEKVLYVSPAYEKIWGRSRESIYEDSMSWLAGVHEEDVGRIVEQTRSGIARPEPVEVEYRVVRPDGIVCWVQTRVFMVPLEGEDTQYVVGVTRDITRERQAEDARRMLEEQLRQSQKMEAVATLAGGIAHDFNNLLGVITGNAELALLEQGLPEDARLSLDEISKAARRALRLVQQLLTLSRDYSPALEVQPLRPLVDDAVRLLRPSLAANVALELSTAAPVVEIACEPSFVQQILVHLVTNAVQAMEERGGTVEVIVDSFERDEDGRGQRCARLVVRDDGCGMNEAVQRRIFEPFFTTRPAGKGSGLGLSVVHGLVGQMNGSITVESRPGEGSAFELLFPEAQRQESEATEVAAEPKPPSERHLLYLDDEEPLVYLAERMLAARGFRVSGFIRPEDALRAVREDPTGFDLVVTDYNMPRVSGLQVAAEIARMNPKLRVMMTSGYITDELREKAGAAGVQYLVEKPDTIDDLCGHVEEALRRS